MNLWLDDYRRPPDPSWTWVKTADEAIEALSNQRVTIASLDHDLADIHYATLQIELAYDEGEQYVIELLDHIKRTGHDVEKTGYDVVLWLVENGHWPTEAIIIHSWNPVGSERMATAIDQHGPYATKCRRIPARNP